MPALSDKQGNEPAAPLPVPGGGTDADAGASFRWRDALGVTRSIQILERAQDVVTVAVGIVLVVLAAVLLVSGIIDFLDGSSGTISLAAPILVDRVLLVLILVEIVHTVVLSLRSHRLVAQPFIVVGLVAVIRRILFVLTPGSEVKPSTSELALLIAMVAVFVAGLIAVSRFEKNEE
ncbi:MAG TPA: phosphate-starvation-inducible PsiE family protein [Streptosporangiaceae bacterium]|nr:phosphate-starvation-inducible PsiE family protein [Streptosporangiaceae bacterium]